MRPITSGDAAVRQWFRLHEGRFPYMYRDTNGFVTVGIGFMLPNELAATRFTWHGRGLGTLVAVSRAEVIVEYRAVAQLPYGRKYSAGWYRQHTRLELADSEIERAFGRILDGFLGELRAALPAFDTYPEEAQLGLLDMAYNLGSHGLLTGWPTFMGAVKKRRWLDAARNCTRPQLTSRHKPDRNDETRALFEAAATADRAPIGRAR